MTKRIETRTNIAPYIRREILNAYPDALYSLVTAPKSSLVVTAADVRHLVIAVIDGHAWSSLEYAAHAAHVHWPNCEMRRIYDREWSRYEMSEGKYESLSPAEATIVFRATIFRGMLHLIHPMISRGETRFHVKCGTSSPHLCNMHLTIYQPVFVRLIDYERKAIAKRVRFPGGYEGCPGDAEVLHDWCLDQRQDELAKRLRELTLMLQN